MCAKRYLKSEVSAKSFPASRCKTYPSTGIKAKYMCVRQNSADKPTLMKVLTSVYHPEERAIFLCGKRVAFETPKDAQLARLRLMTNPCVHTQAQGFVKCAIIHNGLYSVAASSPL